MKTTTKNQTDIHKQFKPNKTPQQVFKMGAFGGTYFRPIHSSVTGKDYTQSQAMGGLPKSWFQGLNKKTMVTSSSYDKKINKQGKEYNDYSVSPVIRQVLLHWGYELKKRDYESYIKNK